MTQEKNDAHGRKRTPFDDLPSPLGQAFSRAAKRLGIFSDLIREEQAEESQEETPMKEYTEEYVERLRNAIREADKVLYEVNMGNYDEEEVARLNNGSIEARQILRAALEEKGLTMTERIAEYRIHADNEERRGDFRGFVNAEYMREAADALQREKEK